MRIRVGDIYRSYENSGSNDKGKKLQINSEEEEERHQDRNWVRMMAEFNTNKLQSALEKAMEKVIHMKIETLISSTNKERYRILVKKKKN